MDASAMREVRLTTATAIFFMGVEEDPSGVDNVDIEVQIGDGSRWGATLIALEEVGRLMARWSQSGENLGGRFCQGDDLVITSQGGIGFLTELLDALVESGEYRYVLKRIDIDE